VNSALAREESILSLFDLDDNREPCCLRCGRPLREDADPDLLSCFACRIWYRLELGRPVETHVPRIPAESWAPPWRRPA
jgi:hypothetical protein